jgi:large subunit ribosomal protein L10
MAKPEKASAVSELAEDFRTSQATLVTEYRGLSVTSMKALRRTLGSTTKYSVVKNTLTKIAAREAGVPIPDEMLKGPSALAFVKGDPIDAARMLRDFSRENPFLVIKGMQLANLESREVLLAKLAGAMKGSIAKAARVFDALRIKLEAGSPSTPSAPAAPVAEAVAVVEEASPVEEAASPEPVIEEAASPEPVIENNENNKEEA